jgi:hypothetical protein
VNRQSDVDPELWAAVADPSRRLLLDVLLSSGEATPNMAATAAHWKTRLKAIQRLAEQAHRAAKHDPSPPA